MKWGLWSTTAASNSATPPDGWPEGQAPSTVNDCAREMMASVRAGLNDLQFVDQGHSPTFVSSTQFTVPGNQLTYYEVGRRVKLFDTSVLYGTVASSTATSTTAVGLRLDSGILSGSLSSLAVSVIGQQNYPLPEQFAAQPNVIINACVDYWTLGNAFTFSGSGVASGGITADRFLYAQNASSVITVQRTERSASASGVPTVAQAGTLINNSIRIAVASADLAIGTTEFSALGYTVEGFDFRALAQREMAFSFWVKGTLTGTYCLSMRSTGLDTCYVAEYALSSVQTWEKKTFAIPPSIVGGTWDYSSGAGLRVALVLAAGSNFQGSAGNWTATDILATSNQVNFLGAGGNTIRFTGFKLEPGTACTPLDNQNARDVVARKRYLQSFNASSGGLLGYCISTSIARIYMPLSPEMRAAPSANYAAFASTFLADGTGALRSVSAINSTVTPGVNGVMMDVMVVGTPLVQGQGCRLIFSTNSVTQITFNAEP